MSLLTNYIFSKNATPLPEFNFWVEGTDWSFNVGVTDEASFITYLESQGATNVIISDFSLVNDGALKCNISCDDLTEISFGSGWITDVVSIGDFSTAGITYIELSDSLFANFNPSKLPIGLINLGLYGCLITTSSWNTNIGYINDLPNDGILSASGNTDSIVGTVSETLFLAKDWTII